MFALLSQTMQMLDNFGPHMRTVPAAYKVVDCEKQSAAGLTCNSVIMSVMEPAGNNSCSGYVDHTSGVGPVCQERPLETVGTSSP
mmetsp:Transcript_18425/g.35906  ORF Transcript_18425/g.35906 Transcript_18425/m.35906 type:complete len:85 (+) Transcript_18425:68-322(+)